jgi:hypothetical protein
LCPMARRRLRVARQDLAAARIGRVEEDGNQGRGRHQLAQQLQSFRQQLRIQADHARKISSRTVEAGDKADPHRVVAAREDDRDRRGRGLGRHGRGAIRRDHRHLATDQVGCHGRQPIVHAIRPAILDCDIAALDMTGFVQALPERAHAIRIPVSRCAVEKPHHRHRRLLRARREWPRRCRAAEQPHELPPSHAGHGRSLHPGLPQGQPATGAAGRSMGHYCAGETRGLPFSTT